MHRTESKHSSPDIVIVGGGPIGWLTALEFRAKSPTTPILIRERSSVYKRTQHVQFDLDLIKDKRLQDKIKEVKDVQFIKKTKISIPIQGLEVCLREFGATGDNPINIEYKAVNSLDELKTDYPDCQLIIATDGARSTLRTSIFGKDAIENVDLQYMIEFKGAVTQELRERLNSIKEGSYNSKLEGVLARGHAQRREDGLTHITDRFIVSREVFSSPGLADVKSANMLDVMAEDKATGKLVVSPQIPQELLKVMRTWLRSRYDLELEEVEQAKLNKVILNLSKSKHSSYHHEKNKQVVFLAGDALKTYPYMNGMGGGIRTSYGLVERALPLLQALKQGNTTLIPEVQKKYEKFRNELCAEICKRVILANNDLENKKRFLRHLKRNARFGLAFAVLLMAIVAAILFTGGVGTLGIGPLVGLFVGVGIGGFLAGYGVGRVSEPPTVVPIIPEFFTHVPFVESMEANEEKPAPLSSSTRVIMDMPAAAPTPQPQLGLGLVTSQDVNEVKDVDNVVPLVAQPAAPILPVVAPVIDPDAVVAPAMKSSF